MSATSGWQGQPLVIHVATQSKEYWRNLRTHQYSLDQPSVLSGMRRARTKRLLPLREAYLSILLRCSNQYGLVVAGPASLVGVERQHHLLLGKHIHSDQQIAKTDTLAAQ
jgi:hypothetical protein